MGKKFKTIEQNWISVKDQLPQSDECVIIRIIENGVSKVMAGNYYNDGEWVGHQVPEYSILGIVTHWMPLPMNIKQKSISCPTCNGEVAQAVNYAGLSGYVFNKCGKCGEGLLSDFRDGEFVWVKQKLPININELFKKYEK